jgi:hypothetical protein
MVISQDRPGGALVLVGLPETEEAFLRTLATPESYSSQFTLGGWPRYMHQWVRPLKRFISRVREFGVDTVCETSLHDIGSRISLKPYSSILLISHWTSSGIELSDGFARPSELCEQLPSEFAGIFDLCICHPIELLHQMRTSRPLCNIRYTPQKVRPEYWLIFYESLFRLCASGRHSYGSAWELLAASLLSGRTSSTAASGLQRGMQ